MCAFSKNWNAYSSSKISVRKIEMSPIILLLIVVTGIIVTTIGLILILKNKPKTTPKIETKPQEDKLDLDDLMDIVKNPNSTSNDIINAMIYFNENFVIDDSNSRQALLFFSRALTHKNKSKNIFQYFHKEIKAKNPRFKNELDNIEMKALS